MNRRYFLCALGAATLTLLTGCKNNINTPFIGYWLEQKEDRPATLHITENGPDLVLRIRQIDILFGGYAKHNFPAKARENGVMTIAGKWQLNFDESSQILSDSDNHYKNFKKISEDEYKRLISD